MGLFEWLFLIVIVLYGYKTYQRQEYWLDRQIARFIRYIKSLLR
jgi:hypothetical protein